MSLPTSRLQPANPPLIPTPSRPLRGRLLASAALGFVLISTARAAELVGYAVLPADTFAAGPPSGAFNDSGVRTASRFPSQPVQGFSAVHPVGANAFLMLSDNGYGTKKNSPDFLLRIHAVRTDPKTAQGGTGAIRWDAMIPLRDPDRKTDFLLVNENTPERFLTGADFDPEALVVAGDGSFWIGDEFGPFLLHFDPTGRLLQAPVPVPDPRPGKDPAKDFVRSPDNPYLSPPLPGASQTAILNRSKGLENLSLGADGRRLFGLLEGPLMGDAADRLRLFEFDLGTGKFAARTWEYRLAAPENAVRDMATVNESEFLVVEGDAGHGTAAKFKKIFRIDLNRRETDGTLVKEEVADLLDVADPRNLAGFGQKFTFPYACIEGLAIVNSQTLVVVNDNNFPATGARQEGVRDPNEWLLLKLDRPLRLVPARP